MAEFGIDSRLVFGTDDKSVADKLEEHNASLVSNANTLIEHTNSLVLKADKTALDTTDKKVKGFINIADYGTLNGDGITSDQTVIAAAVADAKLKGYMLNWGWDGKTYLTTANIPDFHDVTNIGNAIIKRGTDLFHITPTSAQTNIIYTGFGGSSGNDGLSSASPRSIAYVRNLLQNLGSKAAQGQWRVQFVAGTITDTGLVFNNLPYFSKPLQIWGVWDGTNRLAVWDGVSSAAVYAFRSDANNAVLNLEFKDLKFINWAGDPSNAGAIVCWGGAGVQVKTENCEFRDSTIAVWMRSGFSRHYGDVIDNCVWGYGMQYSHSATIGNSAQRVKIMNCDKGVFVARASVAHADYTDFSGNIVDIQVHQKSRVAAVGSTFATWSDVCIWLQGGGLFENDGSTWDPDSITDATPIYRFDTGAAVPAVHIGPLPYRVAHYIPNTGYTLTGNTLDDLLSSQVGFGSPLRMPKNMLYNNATLQINVKCRLDIGGTLGTKTIKLTGPGVPGSYLIGQIVIPTGAAGLGEVSFELTFRANGTAICKAKYESSNASLNAVAFSTVASSAITAIRDKTENIAGWRLYGQLANAADSISLYSITTNLIG